MTSISISQARAILPELLDRVLAGEEVTITRHGTAVAVILRPDAVRVRRSDQAVADAERLRELVEQARTSSLDDVPGLTSDRADELLAELAASRSR